VAQAAVRVARDVVRAVPGRAEALDPAAAARARGVVAEAPASESAGVVVPASPLALVQA
jgi:hypothetical protein